jgi:hypothetical protein
MKLVKPLAAMAAMTLALMALGSTASATTLETNGITKNQTVTIHATLAAGSTMVLSDTGGGFALTCTESTLHGWTTTFTGTTVSGPIRDETVSGQTLVGLSFNQCSTPFIVDAGGTFSVEHISGTTNGTLRSTGAKWTVPSSPWGPLTCTTNNTDIGSLTGTGSGTSIVHINAVINCGIFLPSAKWEGTYNITGHSIGVVG